MIYLIAGDYFEARIDWGSVPGIFYGEIFSNDAETCVGSRLSWFYASTTIIMNVLDQVPIIDMIEIQ